MAAVTVEAWAKVNLYLHVTGRRDDGYHLLDSLVAFAGIGDTVTVSPADRLILDLNGPTAPALAAETGDNIVLRAARALADVAGIAAHAHIRLTKRLPVAAGIGGGSADAAATLRALCRLWNVSLDAARLHALALSLGADVPVCLGGRPARMFGIGERLEPAPALPPAWLVLVNPREALSTPAVFQARHGCFSDPAPLTAPPPDAGELAAMLKQRRNDLTAAAIALCPAVSVALDHLARQPGCLLARMSGSGATCFGLFAEAPAATAAAQAMTTTHPLWWINSAPLLSTP